MSPDTRSLDQGVSPLINGVSSQSESDTMLDVINPSNGQRCLSIPTGNAVDVDRAVAAARTAFEAGHWSDAPPSFKKQVLYRLAEFIEAESGTLDALDAGEMG